MKDDIKNRTDIRTLVNAFYKKMLADEQLGYIFTEVVKIKLDQHLPHLYDFWENALFYTGAYKRDLMDIHLDLHFNQHRLEKVHFDQWLALFNETVDELFAGKKAETAKQRAKSIAIVMHLKIQDLEKKRLEFGN
ncbi:MAG: group III truncated hemoglobin [Bacteroidota bacterium]